MTRLLDSDVVINALRHEPRVRRRLADLEGVPAISTVTLMELSYGVQRSADPATNQQAVDRLLAFVRVLDFDADAAAQSGAVRAELAAMGRPIGAYDALIAGHARSAELVLATGNVREFTRVPGLEVENWRST